VKLDVRVRKTEKKDSKTKSVRACQH